VREKRDDKKKMLLKRIVGLPGEAFYFSEDKTKFDFVVQDSFKNTYRLESDYSLTLDNMVNSENKKKILLGKDDYFVVGENLGASEDSRVFGTVQPVEILGHAILTLPISSLRKGRFW
jgi:signal peptidase I